MTAVTDLQAVQRAYDREHWHHDNQEKMEQIRHVEHHLAKALGKLAAIVESWEHGHDPDCTALDKEIIPDLMAHSLRLANLRGLNVEDAFFERLVDNIRRITGQEPFQEPE